MKYYKKLNRFEGGIHQTTIYSEESFYEEYIQQLERLNKAIRAGKLNTCTTYYWGDHDVLELFDN